MYLTERYLLSAGILSQSGQFPICNQLRGYSWLLSENYPTAFVSQSMQLYMCVFFVVVLVLL